MYQEITARAKSEMDKAVDFFQKELMKVRTGQATPALVEDVLVSISGQPTPLKHIAGISCPNRRQILIQPWDKSYLELIGKALLQSSLGTSPVVDGESVRVHLPQLTQEYRLQLTKLIGERAEESRKTIRKCREAAWEEIQEKSHAGEIREDDKFRAKDELQKIIDGSQKKIETLVEHKKQEIETI